MIIKALYRIFDDIADEMCRCAILLPCEEEQSFSFSYQKYGYSIEGYGKIGGYWFNEGDGYYTPYEKYFKYGWGYLDQVYISYYDKETDEEIELPEETVIDLTMRLDKELNTHMINSSIII